MVSIQEKNIYKKYFENFQSKGFSSEDCDLIALMFEESTYEAEPINSFSISEMKRKGSLTINCTGDVKINCHDSNGNIVERHKISLDVAIMLHQNSIVPLTQCSKHLLEYFGLV